VSWPGWDIRSSRPRSGRSRARPPRAGSRRAGPSRRAFPTTRAEGVIAADFFHVDTITGGRLYAPAFLEHGTRELPITGVTAHPTARWAAQRARDLAADLGSRVESPRFAPRGRGRYTGAFNAVFEAEGVDAPLSAPRAPRMNAHRERAVGTIRREAPDHVLIMNEAHARQVLAEYQAHDNGHRPPRSRGQRPPGAQQQPAVSPAGAPYKLPRARVPGGVINQYQYAA
jgi:hypothetical protein